MKRKMLTAFLTAAMITSLTPAMAFAAPAQEGDVQVQEVGETETDTETGTDTETPDEDVEEVPTTAKKDVPTEETKEAEKVTPQNEEPSSDEIGTQEELEKALDGPEAGGEIDFGGKVFELTEPLYIDKDITISNVTLRGTDNVTGNLVTTLDNNITLENVTIITSSANKNALHAYGTTLTANNLTINHSASANGAPIIVNNEATAEFTGSLNLTLGANSWYGVNVDNAIAHFHNAQVTASPLSGTQSVVCLENKSIVDGVEAYTRVETASDGQVAFVADSNLPQFISAKTTEEKDISSIELYHDVTLTEPLFLSEELILDGNGHTISGSEALGKENVVTVTADDVALFNVTIKTTAANKSPLHIYKADAVLSVVTLDNQETAGGAGMILNGGGATVYRDLNILLGENSWGGINVDTTNGPAGVFFANGSKVTMTGGQNKPVIYIDSDNDVSLMTITGAEAAGLEKAADGSYVLATEDQEKPAPGDGGQGTGNGQQNQNGNNANAANTNGQNVTKAARTGDSNSLFGGAAALLGSGAVAAAVLRKKRGLAE